MVGKVRTNSPRARSLKHFANLAVISLLFAGWSTFTTSADENEEEWQRRNFDPVKLSLDGKNLYASCRIYADQHLDALRKIPRSQFGDDSKSRESDARYNDAVHRLESEFLNQAGYQLDSIQRDLHKFETHALRAPARLLKHIPLEPLGALCRLATHYQGPQGIGKILAAIQANAETERKLDALATIAKRRIEDAETGELLEDPEAERPLTTEEYRKRKEAWEARLREQEEAAQQREKSYAEMAQERLDREAAPLPEAKVSIRKDLPVVEAPPQPTIDPELAKKVLAWHKTYWNAIKPLKFQLSQLMTQQGPRFAFARRETCKLTYAAADKMITDKVLEAPDPAIREHADAMTKLFREAALACLSGQDKISQGHMTSAEKEIAQLATVLATYGLAP